MALLKVNPYIEAVLRGAHGTLIDGIAASEVPDTSGEILSVQGADISSLNDGTGVLNSEHINPDNKQFQEAAGDEDGQWGTIVGRIIFAKKIYSDQDCESERELDLWNNLQHPFIYFGAELFDADGHKNASELASIIRHYHNRSLPIVCRYSIEGSVLDRKGNFLARTLARKVAVTIKPCNHSAISNLVEFPNVMEKNEKCISVYEMEYSLLIEDPIERFDSALTELKELKKALTLGSANVAPGSLVGGSALSVEDTGKEKFLKNQVLAAVRDWDGKSEFKKFLKSRLLDIDEKFIDKFSGMADQLRFKKAEDLAKADVPLDLGAPNTLKPLDSKVPAGTKKFKGKHVQPGEVELVAGPFQGNKLKLLHLDDNYAYVQPFKGGDEQEVKVNKLNRNVEGSHFIVSQEPKALNLPNHVHGDKHADLGLTHFHEQKELMHGINLAEEPTYRPFGATEARTKGDMASGWYKSAHDKMGYVKPAVEFDFEETKPKDEHYMNTARREVVFHNLAKKYFGLGDHVPTTALFKHPDTNHEHSVMEMIPGAEHVQSKSPSHESRDRLVHSGDIGQLDKMAIMDTVMGNGDRNKINYMTSANHPGVHLIDNALIFQYDDKYVPSYLTDYHQMKGEKMDEAHMHPDALRWLVDLDPFKLSKEMEGQGVHPKVINNAVTRLISMQSNAVMGNTKKNHILFAHNQYAHEPVKREVG